MNGEPAANVFDLNSRAGYSDVVPVGLGLNRGTNTIKIGCSGYSSMLSSDISVTFLQILTMATDFTVNLSGIEVLDEY